MTDSASITARLAAMTRALLAINAADTFDRLALSAAAGALEVFGAAAGLTLMLPDGQVRRTFINPVERVPRRRGGRQGLLEALAGPVIGDEPGTGTMVVAADRWHAIVPDSVLTGEVVLAASRTKPRRPPVVVAVDRDAIGGEADRHLLRQFAQSVALAVEALRAQGEEHFVALRLQRSFLPTDLPQVPGLQIAVRYEPSSDQAEVGGDFYEVMMWQGRVLAAIGDVQGHSLDAAIVMGELRHALRAFAVEGHPPSAILTRLDTVLQRFHPGILATLCMLAIDPATGDMEIVNSGHVPPLLVDGDKVTYVGQGGLLLGVAAEEPHVEHTVLPPGGLVVLTTDGLIEDREVPIDVNLERLRLAGQEPGEDPEAFSDRILAMFGRREDDVALLVLRRA